MTKQTNHTFYLFTLFIDGILYIVVPLNVLHCVREIKKVSSEFGKIIELISLANSNCSCSIVTVFECQIFNFLMCRTACCLQKYFRPPLN